MAPLAGHVVVDLTRYLPGPLATLLLAEEGARVIKVEQPDGDPVRHLPPFDAQGRSAFHAFLNRGKESVVLDLRTDAGVAALRGLVARADALVESFRPGVLARLGLDPAALVAEQPRLVACSLSGYGTHDPRAPLPGHDLGYLAAAGVLGQTGPVEGPPAPSGAQIADGAGAYEAAFRITAALLERERSGRGAWLDVSLDRAAARLMAPHALAATLAAEPPRGRAPLSGGMASYRTYACADGGHVALAALEPRFFARACELLGRPELAAQQLDPEAQDDLAAELAAIFATRPRDAWAELLAGEDTCLVPVLTLREAIPDPFKLCGAALPEARPLGADTERVLAE